MSRLPFPGHDTGIVLLYLYRIPRTDIRTSRTDFVIRCIDAQGTDQYSLADLKIIFPGFRKLFNRSRRADLRTARTPRVAVSFREVKHRLQDAFHTVLRRAWPQHLCRALADAGLAAVAKGIQMLMTYRSRRRDCSLALRFLWNTIYAIHL